MAELLEAKQSEVSVALSKMHNKKEFLQKKVNMLADRLTNVLRPESDTKPPTESQKGFSCPLATELSTITDAVDVAALALENLLDRLEL